MILQVTDKQISLKWFLIANMSRIVCICLISINYYNKFKYYNTMYTIMLDT